MVSLRIEPRAQGWKLQTNPLSYACTPRKTSCDSLQKTLQEAIAQWIHLRLPSYGSAFESQEHISMLV